MPGPRLLESGVFQNFFEFQDMPSHGDLAKVPKSLLIAALHECRGSMRIAVACHHSTGPCHQTMQQHDVGTGSGVRQASATKALIQGRIRPAEWLAEESCDIPRFGLQQPKASVQASGTAGAVLSPPRRDGAIVCHRPLLSPMPRSQVKEICRRACL